MRFMVIERFRNKDARSVYERARAKGRMLPEGLEYLDSWVASRMDRCFQLMECRDESLLRRWIKNWDDLVEFEVIPVISSEEASRQILQAR